MSSRQRSSIATMARDSHSRKTLKRPILLMMGIWLSSSSSPVASFLMGSPGQCSLSSSSFPFRGILETREEDVSDIGGGVDFSSFNPLKPYKSDPTKNSKRIQYTGTKISLRQTSMQELTEKLLDVVGDREETHSLLVEYQEFLLEPLEDQDAVLEPGSIYSPGMSRDDRYETYKRSMDERIGSCRNLHVRLVLEAMREFVLSFYN